jgi:hypothetical protein
MSVKYLYLAAAVAAVACTSGPQPPSSSTGIPRISTVITSDEIADTHADVGTAYEAVARLRPNWLAPHGVTTGRGNPSSTEYATVFVDGQQAGSVSALRNIQAYQVASMTYYDVTQAGARFGIQGGSSGVIDVTLKSGGSQ